MKRAQPIGEIYECGSRSYQTKMEKFPQVNGRSGIAGTLVQLVSRATALTRLSRILETLWLLSSVKAFQS